MLCEAVLVDREDTCRIKREVIRFMERDTLWCTIDIHTLHRTVTLHDAFTGSIVSVTWGFTINVIHNLLPYVRFTYIRRLKIVIYNYSISLFK